MRKGINLLEDLCERHPAGKRDYIYYLAFGYARLQDYSLSLKYIDRFLQIEPENEQAKNLQELVKSKRRSDATKGAAVVGGESDTSPHLMAFVKSTIIPFLAGATLIAGGLLALGFGLLKK